MPSKRPSRRRPWGSEPAPLDLGRALGGLRSESGADGEWSVRTVRSGDKSYVCPGCRQTIPAGTSHVVAWANDSMFGAASALEDRRHWHSGCWSARERRR